MLQQRVSEILQGQRRWQVFTVVALIMHYSLWLYWEVLLIVDILDMSLHVAFLGHSTVTIWTLKGPLARVGPHVPTQICLAAEFLVTHDAPLPQNDKLQVPPIIFHIPLGLIILQRKPQSQHHSSSKA